MNWDDLWRAVALTLVLEGLMPFAAPARWREALASVAQLPDRVLRLIGLGAMLCGLVLLQIV